MCVILILLLCIGGEEMPFMRERLKQRRVDMGLTLQEVADTIGVEKPTVQRYESGKISRIDTLTVEKLATAVRCSPSFLMGWSEGARDKPVSESVSMTKPEKMSVLYDRIKERRSASGLTLLEVAEKLGVKEATMQRYESGQIKNIRHETILALSSIFSCSPSYLMGWIDTLFEAPAADTPALSKPEKRIVEAFRSLNEEGQEKVVDYIDDLVQSGKYIKNNSYGMAVEVKQA